MVENDNPLKDTNEIINIINREGIFFRSAVKKKFEESHWKCEIEYPYSLQNFVEEKGISKSIDIYATRIFSHPDSVELNLIIECKKSYAPQNKWIFFKNKKDKLSAWNIQSPKTGGILNCLSQISPFDIISCYDQIVIKPKDGKQQNKGEKLIQDKKRDVTQIYQASSEISNALYGIISMFPTQRKNEHSLILRKRPIFENNWFIPVVITNAELNICEFEISNTTLMDGKIEEKKFKLEPVSMLTFEYPLPYYLQIAEDEMIPTDLSGISTDVLSFSYIRKLPIVFLNSMNIDEFLKIVYYSLAPNSWMIGKIK